ncbi:TetR/AcrR family transcriptional regulator [Sedimentibacter sp.]|uniref:TetR/AcrR family transcriptional regulator n=1 Tax=Sedimentibacter sp. TaxID=1960295 RepID=UPI0028B23F61|nr:TetR/AcrR family transcriptional regulator [Sedimentibacter sp.]
MKEEDTRERILNAAKEVFSNKGYSGSTTKEISLAADVAEVTLFRHFETKNNLFYETISTFIVKPMLNFNVSKEKENSDQFIQKIIEERTYTLRKNRKLFICTIYESQYNDEIKKVLKSIFSKVFDEIVYFMKDEQINFEKKSFEYYSQIILSTIVGLIIFESLTGSDTFRDSRKLYETIKTLVL